MNANNAANKNNAEMADSDDEYDRKRRDKFRGERAEASYRGAERVSRPRDDWSERESWSRPRQREYRSGMRDRGYSPGLEPAPKRLRHDYYGDSYYNHYAPYHQPAHREPASAPQIEGQPPPMMSFKAFLATQDDNISDSEAIEKYNDYKLEFQRQQLNEFFVAHKDDEWFRLKYHPEDSIKRKEEQAAALKKRLEVFLDLQASGAIDKITIDCPRTNELLKLLDTVVIKLEGGTDEDLALLEKEYTEMEEKYKEQKAKEEAEKAEKAAEAATNNLKKEDSETTADKSDKTELKTNGESDNKHDEDGELLEDKPGDVVDVDKKSDEDKMEEDQQVDEKEDASKDEEASKDAENEGQSSEVNNDEEKKDDDTEKGKPEKKRKRSYSGSSSSSSSSSGSEDGGEKKQEGAGEKGAEDEKEKEKVEKDDDKIQTIEDDKPDKPKSLHKTTSIFLRNLSPTITKQEVEAMCSRYDGFLRVALADPQPDRRWLRRGWVTFKRDANIKEICWNLNNIRLRECELGAIVNRDLSRRIRPVNGITAHKSVVRSDIRIAAKVTLHLDNKAGLWLEDDDKKEKPQQTFGLVSNNPVLHNITDYLIEEASAEEEELLGLEPSSDNQDAVSTVERDDNLIHVLDRILLYLRIVHSVDYYNHCEYPNEDEMPNRCGILHARGPPPTSKTDMTQFIGNAVESKMSSFLPDKPAAEGNTNEAKLINLSLKDVDTEIDKFVQANTRELAKDKWLCPLSGKKFKGPDFVRKHIFNKHGEKIEEVKKEVEFFNNYLKDPKRPMLVETAPPKREEPAPYSHPSYGGGASYGGGGYGRPQPYYNQGFQRSRGYPPRARGNAGDFRPIIHYRDLDAPREPEEFI
ncbi:serrate RNA effector molecule homolog isoform X2 [Aethina tumida]|uniref:serrate RNA effector molecule homolog isoform X2 n=1 Tax=Aethina tumida TaxID=116153 RepID=UPI002149369A|nr:serrate RNA effector molecule homolog isoform X2 [Aethina tumida]